jgi:hypothetical protein
MPGVGLEVAQELLVMAALLERREAELLVELRRFWKMRSGVRRKKARTAKPKRASRRRG